MQHTEQEVVRPVQRMLRSTWQGTVATYRVLNRASYHALGFLLKALVIGYFAFCGLFLALRYLVLPNIDQYKPQIEKVATHAVGRPVTIGTVHASWRGLHPELTLKSVVVHNRTGDPAMSLPSVSATVSWWSVVAAELRLEALEIQRPDIEIERDAEGALYVGGIYIDSTRKGDGSGLEWLLRQKQIVVRDGWLRWKDGQRGAPELVLTGISAVLQNNWLQHKFTIKASPPPGVSSQLDLRAAFSHAPFSRTIADTSLWKGTLYADWRDTDLAQWKTWLDYPVEVQQGRGAVRAWLSFDQARVDNLTVDLSVTNLSTRLRPDLPLMNLVRVNGRVSGGEAQGPAVKSFWLSGKRGHSLSLTDFSFETVDGVRLLPTTLSEQFVEATKTAPAQTELKIDSIDLHAIADFAGYLPLDNEQRRLLAELAPSGKVQNLSAKWQGDFPKLQSYQLKADFAGLSLRARSSLPVAAATAASPATARTLVTPATSAATITATPGFDNLTGSVDMTHTGGSLRLNSSKAVLHFPGYFHEPAFPFEELSVQSRWTVQEKNRLQVQLNSMQFQHEGIAGTATGRYAVSLDPALRNKGTLELSARASEIDVQRLGRYMPAHAPEKLAQWLTGALHGGKLTDLNLLIKGDLADFPFRTARPTDKPKGQFHLSGRIEDGKLNYAPAVPNDAKARPSWPLIENINGRLAIDRARLEVHADRAKTHQAVLSNVDVVMPDLLASERVLNVTGSAAGPLQELIGFTVDSPVGGWIGNFTNDTIATGDARLSLDLQLLLARLPSSRVKGAVRLENNDITLFSGMPQLQKTNGEIQFTEKGFDLAGVRANFLGGVVNASGGTQRDGSLAVRAEGAMQLDGLRRAYPSAAMQRLLQRVRGNTRYSVQVNARNKIPEIIVESSLQGVTLDFPSPLRKSATEPLPLRLDIARLPSSGGVQRDEVKVSLGGTINSRHQRRRLPGKDSAWQVLAGGIGVNVPAPQPDSGVVVNVSLRSLDIDAWRNTMSAIIGGAGSKADTDGAPADHLNLAQYVDPEVLAARATELLIANKKLDNVVVGASHQNGVWQANIDSAQVAGHLTWAESRSGRGRGRVTARLASLIVPPSAAADVSDLLEGKGGSTIIPALDVVAENFELFGKKFGRLELQANNAATTGGREWRINKLSVNNPDAAMSATGRYTSQDGVSKSSLNYKLDIADAGRLLDRLGFARVLAGGKGVMSGEVGWNGMPYSIDMASLTGQLNFDLASGRFLKVDPGAAKLLGVLSLQSLPRRLVLDFRDIFSEGFLFDGASASASINKGLIRTDNFKMRSVSAAVLMDGSVDIAKESQNLHVVVIPEINAGTASVAYGLMVNPVIGLGSFLAQLFLRDPLMRAFTVEYEITGQWKDPAIRKLPRSFGLASNGNNGGTTSNGSAANSNANNGNAVPATPATPAAPVPSATPAPTQ